MDKTTTKNLPNFSGLDIATIETSLDELLARNRAALADITGAGHEATFATLVAPLEVLAQDLERFWAPVRHLHGVADSEALRDAYNACMAKLTNYWTALGQNAELCAAFKSLRASPGYDDLDTATHALIDHALRDFRLAGVDLDEAGKAVCRDLFEQLAALETRFGENVLDATDDFALLITDEQRLAGIPESVQAMAAARAERRGEQGWSIGLEMPVYMGVVTHAVDRELRHAVYEAYVTRASDQGPAAGRFDNSGVMHEILERREQLARTLGFANYAEYSLATKMAGDTAEVDTFLTDLARLARPAAEREYAELTAFARDELNIADPAPWDLAYAGEKLREARFAVADEQLRPYFPLERVLDGMFAITGRIFGLSFEPVADVDRWHDDVQCFTVHDAAGEARGMFYLDPYARAGKHSGAWMDECLTRWHSAAGLQRPVAFLTCNFAPPSKTRPSLLTHREVTTLFHEFGHGLHHMLTRVDRPAVAGINGVAWDAVELPSQFLENWCWHPEALTLFSGHFETGETLPAEILDKLLAAKHFQSGMQTLRQVELALFDFRLHMADAAGVDVQALLDAVRAEVAVVPVVPWNRFQHGFSHIFAGGYAAGYYSYKWAEVLSADAFSRFEEEGVFNTDTGNAFLTAILEQGGSRDAAVLFREFRGREPSIDALLRHSGLAA
ncbi:MAG: M3 family metallopeptidase [Gammaproteobacteria bacterium]|nr:M3 family metallopeptidase [Gammaproteobacteria bacterium]